jgi:molecular chaperone DnaK
MKPVDILGIDLGTTKSVIAIWQPETETTRVLPNHEGGHITPSVVTFDRATGEPIVGEPAVHRMEVEPEAVIYSVKRFIGRLPEDQKVIEDEKRVTYDIHENAQHQVVVSVLGRELTPPEVSCEVLRKLKRDGSDALGGREIGQAVISVPAYFNDAQRRATKLAGELAGLFVPYIIAEPTAAALAFGLGETATTVAVYDLGGGTFDISIMHVEDGLFRVIAIGGDTHLGGDDFDYAIVDWMGQEFAQQHPDVRLPIDDEPRLRARLRDAARDAKVALTGALEQRIQLADVIQVEGEGMDLDLVLTRAKLEELIQPFVARSLALVDETIATAKKEFSGKVGGRAWSGIDQVLLVGGQTRTPAIRAALRDHLGLPLNDSVPPEEAVARGAAILGARLCGYLFDQVKLVDAVPLSLGVELATGRLEVVIPANEQIPTQRWRRDFTTGTDRQKRLRFKVWQGERPLAKDNTYIGEVVLPLTTAGQALSKLIAVQFKVDRNGILSIQAAEADTEARPVQVVFAYGAMTQDELQARLQEIETHAAEDALKRRLLELGDEVVRLKEATASLPAGDPQRQRLIRLDSLVAAGDADTADVLLAEMKTALRS